ncbi:MAG: hypothetical protein QXV73_04050 [Candidatus Micrarchaeia archaeon]
MVKRFINWANHLVIFSKEKGKMLFTPNRWYYAQKYIANEILREIENKSPIRNFVILKGRQQGCTTLLLALDLFWVQTFSGIKLGFLTQDYEARPKLREIVRTMYLHLPRTHKLPVIIDNRTLMQFSNNSEFLFFHVSSRESTKQSVARSQALTCIHATEVAFYSANDPEEKVLKSLMVSSAKTHPHRYTILESTANGFNSFYDRYMEAKNNPTSKAIFVGWWGRDDYVIKKDDPLFKVYGYPMSREEQRKIELVKKMYGYEISIEQLAWWRKELDTTFNGDENYCLQELPFYDEEAFRLSGYKFFDAYKLMEDMKKVATIKPYYFYINADTQGVYIDTANQREANLHIYEFPKLHETYFIGADPSYGSSKDSDMAVISIWKGYKDKLVQVAEFRANNIGVIEFAKICLFLCAFYKNSYLNLEINGVGQVIIKEMNDVKGKLSDIGNIVVRSDVKDINLDVIKANIPYIREYLYTKQQTLKKNYIKFWNTTGHTKPPLLNQFKSVYHLNMLEIKSKALLEEMQFFVQTDKGELQAEEGKHDDRILAAALAVEFWRKYIYHRLPSYEDSLRFANEVDQESTNKLIALGLYKDLAPFIAKPNA